MELLARTCKTEAMNVQRIWARVFVILGGVLWIMMAWGAQRFYLGAALSEAIGYALVVTLAIAAVFVVGMFYEYIAAGILAVGAVALLVFGLFQAWEAGVWGVVLLFFVVPMITAAILYAMAARMQRVCLMKDTAADADHPAVVR